MSFPPEGTHHFLENFLRILTIVEDLFDGGEQEAVVALVQVPKALPVTVRDTLETRFIEGVTVTFLLTDGRSLTGVISGADDRTLTIRTATDTLVLDRREIDEQTVQQTSLMPDGMLASYAEADVRDLIAYLMSSEQVPLPAGRTAAASE